MAKTNKELWEEIEKLSNRVAVLENQLADTQTQKEVPLELIVTDYLHKLGVPAHLKGHDYLRTAVIMVIGNPSLADYITGKLYPGIAEQHNSTKGKVERAIHNAIEVSWLRADINFLQKVFGYTVTQAKGRPTNSEFICLLSDYIRLRRKI